MNGKRSLAMVTHHFAHLSRTFKGRRAAGITSTDVRAYIARQQEKAANATINRELAMLKRAFMLGIDPGNLTQRPMITLLREDNVSSTLFVTGTVAGTVGKKSGQVAGGA